MGVCCCVSMFVGTRMSLEEFRRQFGHLSFSTSLPLPFLPVALFCNEKRKAAEGNRTGERAGNHRGLDLNPKLCRSARQGCGVGHSGPLSCRSHL